MLKKAGVLFASFLFLTPLMFGQYNRLDIAVSGTDSISKQSQGNNVIQTATNNGGVLITARFRFAEHHALEFNYGRSGNSQLFNAPPFDFRIQAKISEYSGAYVFTPIETRNFEPYLLAGIGGLKFNPYGEFIANSQGPFSPQGPIAVQEPVSVSSDTELAFIYGGGFDYKIFTKIPIVSNIPFSSRFAIRLQYRGLLYKAPSFSDAQLFTGARGHIAEPSVGLVFKF